MKRSEMVTIAKLAAQFTVAELRVLQGDSDPRLTRKQAAKHLNISARSFDRKRTEHPIALAPADKHPLRWSRNALDVFKIHNGSPMPARRGRKPKAIAA